MMGVMNKSTLVSVRFCIGVLILAPVYWFLSAMASWNGPPDDIAIIYILAAPITLHAFITGKYGFKRAAKSALMFFAVVAALCFARHIELSTQPGYSARMAARCLESLAWSVPWFLGGRPFTNYRKTVNEPELAAADDWRSAADP